MAFHRARLVGATVLVAALALAGCAGDDDSADATDPATAGPTTTAAATTTTAASEPCTPGDGYTAGTTTHELTVAGTQRQFLVHLPPEPAVDMALIVDFHGANSNMQQQAIYSGFDALSDEEGFVVATPNGVDAPIRQWRFLGTPDDVDFAEAIVGELAANACIDAERVYATGISSGGAMTASLACQASDVFHGFAPVAANFYIPQVCDSAEQRPVVIFHGTDDAVVPYDGGRVGTGSTPVQPAEESAQLWATHNGCTSGPSETSIGSEVVRLDWSGCAEPVVMYRIVGGGHTWPGAIDVGRLGMTTHQVNASTEMWELFDDAR
jgi:polyhydroxybutyrate depolymerase